MALLLRVHSSQQNIQDHYNEMKFGATVAVAADSGFWTSLVSACFS